MNPARTKRPAKCSPPAPPAATLSHKKKPAEDSLSAVAAARSRKRSRVAVTLQMDPEQADLLDGLWASLGLRNAILQRNGIVGLILHCALGEYLRTGTFSGRSWMTEDFPPDLIEARKAGIPYSPASPSQNSGPLPQKIIPFPGSDLNGAA